MVDFAANLSRASALSFDEWNQPETPLLVILFTRLLTENATTKNSPTAVNSAVIYLQSSDAACEVEMSSGRPKCRLWALLEFIGRSIAAATGTPPTRSLREPLAPYCIGLDRCGSSCSCTRYVLERFAGPLRPPEDSPLSPMSGEVSDVIICALTKVRCSQV